MKTVVMVGALFWCGAALGSPPGSAVVANGRFTNVYVYVPTAGESWDVHVAAARPADGAQFSRAAIDKFTETLLEREWPSYFDWLKQYGVNPPQFMGSLVASPECVSAAMKDRVNGVLQWGTIRTLSACHAKDRDPSSQVNLIFSHDIQVAAIDLENDGGDMCATANGWHAWGIGTPHFTALPIRCAGNFMAFTGTLSHEIVETITDPAGFGVGNFGEREVSDNCAGTGTTTWSGYTVQRYWSVRDNPNCQPRLDPPTGSNAYTWALGQGRPLGRLSDTVHDLTLSVPRFRERSSAPVTRAIIVLKNGSDELGTASVDVTLNFAGGSSRTTYAINARRFRGEGETFSALLDLPSPAPTVDSITGVTLRTHLGSGREWDVDSAALVVSFAGAPTAVPAVPRLRDLLDVTPGPRFTGRFHEYNASIPVDVTRNNVAVAALRLMLTTGADDLRGGSNPGDNCDVVVRFRGAPSVTLTNVNQGANWQPWSVHSVLIPLPPGFRAVDLTSIRLRTGFTGGISGDNWDVFRVRLQGRLTGP
jgi:hypothetical protein